MDPCFDLEKATKWKSAPGGVASSIPVHRVLRLLLRAAQGSSSTKCYSMAPGAQEMLRAGLGALEVLWVGVLSDSEVAAAREALRPDREPGMRISPDSTVDSLASVRQRQT